MPTPQHEALHRIFTHDKKLIARTLRRVFEIDVEALVDVSILNTDYTAEPGGIPAPHGDSALLGEFLVEGRKERFIIIVESQTEEDREISYRWPYYATFLHTKHKCQVMLVVVTSKQKTAEWARKPITNGPPGIPCVHASDHHPGSGQGRRRVRRPVRDDTGPCERLRCHTGGTAHGAFRDRRRECGRPVRVH